MKFISIRATVLSALLTTLLVLQGCSTISGLGQDVGALGDAIDRKARQKKGY
ncbi:MAG: entericidin A/B family lipoprotein [Gammaproteobacteria bacterium]